MSELLNFLLKNEYQFRRTRLAALYSDFRQLRALNPDGYVANVEAWRKGLADATRAGHVPSQGSTSDLLILKVDEELLRALETKEWGRPLALGTVINEAVAAHEMIPLQQFNVAKESIYQQSWGVRPWQIISWGLRQLGLAGGQSGEDKLPVGKLVVLANLEEASKNFSSRITGNTSRVDRIYSQAAFEKSFADVLGEKSLSHADVEVFLKFLSRDKAVLAYDGQTVKIKGQGEANITRITPEDASIASLKSLIADLELQTAVLTRKVDELDIMAREAVTRKNRASALASLRSKKLAESTLAKRNATLGQLEGVFASIEQAADQVELVRVMEGSAKVLSGLNAEVGGVERVDDVVEQLREQMTQVDEIGNVIAEVGQGTGAVDEAEVDDELEALEREDREKREEEERKVREEKERNEAAEIKRKLDSLEEAERQAEFKAEKESSSEDPLEESTKELRRLSLVEEPSQVPA
ncbi:Snf7 family protein [Phlyctema vagabunda]|uniref:Snf7 family protein n=1 Tax=Phlyctema vagabunda TaxID=108571 RepID=A0ABR4PRP4_9HELO